MAEHTPTPWKLSAIDGWDIATSERDGVILRLVYNNPANMAFAVHAANCHDDLLAVCKAWDKYDSEMGDKHPCPDYTLRVHYRNEARRLTEIAIAKAERGE